MTSSDSPHISTRSSLPASSGRLGLQMLITFAMMFLATEAGAKDYIFERLWPQLLQLWYFSQPQAMAIDNKGNVYVSDVGFGHIQVFLGLILM